MQIPGFQVYRSPAETAAAADEEVVIESKAADGADAGNDNAFAVPDAYKEKVWAKGIKNVDDLWKQTDASQALIGKKMVVPDFDKAEPKEIEEYVNNLRPKDKAAYKFSDTIPEEDRTVITDIIHKVGLPAPMANQLMEGLMGHVTGMAQKLYDKDGFAAELKTSFGNDFEKIGGDTAKIIAGQLNTEDRALLEKMPNQSLGLIYRLAAGMQKAYGAKESGAAGDKGQDKVGTVDVSAEQKRIRDEIVKLAKKPHTAEDKQRLVDELNATYLKK